MKSRKKILLISSSSQLGGGPKHIFLLKDLLKDKYDFYFALPKSDLFKNKLDIDKYIEITERRISLSDIYKLAIFSKRNSIDIIHSHGKGAGLIGRIIKIFLMKPLIYTFHGIHTLCLNNFQRYFYILYEKLTGWIDDEKIFVSQSEMQQANKLKLFSGKNFSIINNATREMPIKKEFKSEEGNFKMGIKNTNRNIISVCRLVDQKNIFEIFRIADGLPKYNFIVLGYGYLYSEACKFISTNNIRNVYLFGNKKNVFEYLYKSDLFLTTSLYEGHPISVVEAMSIGMPILASKVTGNCDTISHNVSGLFYKLGDIQQAKDFVSLIMENPEIRFNLSLNAYKTHRSKFNLLRMKKSYLEIYNSL